MRTVRCNYEGSCVPHGFSNDVRRWCTQCTRYIPHESHQAETFSTGSYKTDYTKERNLLATQTVMPPDHVKLKVRSLVDCNGLLSTGGHLYGRLPAKGAVYTVAGTRTDSQGVKAYVLEEFDYKHGFSVDMFEAFTNSAPTGSAAAILGPVQDQIFQRPSAQPGDGAVVQEGLPLFWAPEPDKDLSALWGKPPDVSSIW
jgi:hypothetical protein